jgi:hypothetical protein
MDAKKAAINTLPERRIDPLSASGATKKDGAARDPKGLKEAAALRALAGAKSSEFSRFTVEVDDNPDDGSVFLGSSSGGVKKSLSVGETAVPKLRDQTGPSRRSKVAAEVSRVPPYIDADSAGENTVPFSRLAVVLSELQAHEHAWVFAGPLDVEALGLEDFWVVTGGAQPDLGSIRDRLGKREYSSASECCSEVRRMLVNVMTYVKPGSQMHAVAVLLLDHFRALLVEEIKAACVRQAGGAVFVCELTHEEFSRADTVHCLGPCMRPFSRVAVGAPRDPADPASWCFFCKPCRVGLGQAAARVVKASSNNLAVAEAMQHAAQVVASTEEGEPSAHKRARLSAPESSGITLIRLYDEANLATVPMLPIEDASKAARLRRMVEEAIIPYDTVFDPIWCHRKPLHRLSYEHKIYNAIAAILALEQRQN